MARRVVTRLCTMAPCAAFAFSFVSAAYGKTCELEIGSTDQMTYDKKELTFDSTCGTVTVNLLHKGKLGKEIMGHNWVLVATPDKQAVLDAALKAGVATQYVPKDDKRILAASDLIGGGGKTSVKVDVAKLKKGGDYTFVCTFPGHSALMTGKVIVK